MNNRANERIVIKMSLPMGEQWLGMFDVAIKAGYKPSHSMLDLSEQLKNHICPTAKKKVRGRKKD